VVTQEVRTRNSLRRSRTQDNGARRIGQQALIPNQSLPYFGASETSEKVRRQITEPKNTRRCRSLHTKIEESPLRASRVLVNKIPRSASSCCDETWLPRTSKESRLNSTQLPIPGAPTGNKMPSKYKVSIIIATTWQSTKCPSEEEFER
jgi:hypothetical protein